MHIGEIIRADSANGLGIRLSVFVSGCLNHCEGCFQPETWAFDYGEEYTDETENFIINELKKPYYQGLTLLGGEPFEESNQRTLIGLIRRVKKELPEKDIWIYTGYTLDKDLCEGGRKHTEVTDEILNSTDVLVDGKFKLDLKDITLKFRGSSNQRVIDLNKTRETGEITQLSFN